MKFNAIIDRIKQLLSKIGAAKTALIVVLLGAVLLIFRPSNDTVPVQNIVQDFEDLHEVGTEERMSAILSKVEGAGRVEIMLTLRSEGETEYQTDREEVYRGDESQVRVETVFASQSSEQALIRKVTAPEYLGAVVIAQGADDADVCYRLAKAVSSLTGLGIDKITILKMKK